MFGNPNSTDLKSAAHRRQFVDFRVVVYRLHLPSSDTFKLKGSAREYTYDVIFNSDFGDMLYKKISDSLNDPSDPDAFEAFITAYAKSIQARLTDGSSGGKALSMRYLGSNPGDGYDSSGHKYNSAPFQEIDITPLVRSVSTRLALEPVNECSLTMFDPQMTNFSDLELARSAHVSRASPEKLELLKSFRFREFDLVRVFAYSDIEVSPGQKSVSMRALAAHVPSAQGVGPTQSVGGVFADGLESRFYVPPIFTGLVNTVTRGNAVGQSATLNVGLLGLQRMFMQSVSVFNDALANILATAAPDLTTLHDSFELADGKFSDQSADSIVTKLFGDYLLPLYLKDSANSGVLIGVPDLDTLIGRLFGKDGKAFLYPMLPTIVLLHMLKKKYGEPIMMFDDRVNPRIRVISETEAGSTSINMSASLSTALQPYLLRFRDSFSVYNAEYQSAEDIFQAIRETTFMELFEDRTGCFHFRFPKYNSVNAMVYINPSDVISVSHVRSDSAIFTADVAQLMFPLSGVNNIVEPKVFVDKFSILKFGLRRPQTVSNPNAGTDVFATELSKFNRDYHSYGRSRTATIVKIGDPNMNIGQLVLFRLRRDFPVSASDGSQDGSFETFAGYVIQIAEEVSVGGEYLQTLQLAFVRQAFQVASPTNTNLVGTVWDVSSLNPNTVRDTGPLGLPLVTKSNLESVPTAAAADTRGFLYAMSLTGKNNVFVSAHMTRVADPLDLAQAASDDKGVEASAQQAALAAGFGRVSTLAANVASQKYVLELIEQERRALALVSVRAAILRDFIPAVQRSLFLLSGVKTFGGLYGFRGEMISGLRIAVDTHRSSYTADIFAANGSAVSFDSTITPAAAQLSPDDIGHILSLDRLIGQADQTSRSDPFQSSSRPFVDRWNRMFTHDAPLTPLSPSDRTEASSVLTLFMHEIDAQLVDAGSELNDRSTLKALAARLDGLNDAINKAPKVEAPVIPASTTPSIPK